MSKQTDKKSFNFLVEAVQDNLRINEGRWESWQNAKHIQEVYGELEEDFKDIMEEFLNCLIRLDGDSAETFIEAYRLLNY